MIEFARRRSALLKALTEPLLIASGSAPARNYPANPYPFRADSNALYFFGPIEPDAFALFDPADGSVTLFLPERTIDDTLWHGARESFEDARARRGVSRVLPSEKLEVAVRVQLNGRPADAVAVADMATSLRLSAVVGRERVFGDPKRICAPSTATAIAALRLTKTEPELEEMRKTAAVTQRAHVAAMRATVAGASEELLAGIVEGTFAEAGCVPAYGTILTVRGEVLHQRDHGGVCANGDIVLLDAGAEASSGYCSDVTRAWPVGAFSAEGRDVYDLVLASQLAAIHSVRPGVRYRDIHFTAARVIADGLKTMGLLTCSVDAAIESGAHALFFPHGVGHPIGLDVHDGETFGDQILYPNGRTRSTQFGTAYLRMDMDLKEDMTFTVEPGVYFVPAILRSKEFREKFAPEVDFARADKFLEMNGGRGFGGIRIEDDVRCVPMGAEVLTVGIPKARAELEALVGSAPRRVLGAAAT